MLNIFTYVCILHFYSSLMCMDDSYFYQSYIWTQYLHIYLNINCGYFFIKVHTYLLDSSPL